MSFPRYPKYKDSGVEWLGPVPAHWEVKPLKYNLRLLTEKTDKRQNPVALENIESWTGRFIQTDTEFQGEGVEFVAGDILFGKLRPYLAKAYRAESSGEAVGDFHVMRPDEGIYSRFAQYQILSPEFIAIVDGSTFGSKMPRAGWEFVGGMPMTTPPLPEQRQIAGFLDRETAQIDALVAEQERLLELLKEKRQAVISHAVTRGLPSTGSGQGNPTPPLKPSGLAWLGDVPAHWEVKQLRHLITKIEQGSSPQCESDPAEGDQWGVLKVGCVNGAAFDPREQKALPAGVLPEKQYAVREGDILMSRGNTLELVGQAAVVPDGCGNLLLSDLLYRFRPLEEAAVAKYLVAVLRSALGRLQIERDATGTSPSMKKIGQGNIREFVIALPPLSEQRVIVAHLDAATAQFDALTAAVERALALLQERRTALISAAVTGRIDIRGAVA